MTEFKLNPQQKAAVFHKDGPIVVIAVPGAGKTAVAVKRFQRLMVSGVPSERILCTTFTRKAAQEMKDRVRLKMGQAAYIGTLHSILWRVMKPHMGKIYPNIDSGDQLEVIERNFQRNKVLIDVLRSRSGISENDVSDTSLAMDIGLPNVLTAIGMLKNYDVGPESVRDEMMLGPFEFKAPEFAKEWKTSFAELYQGYEDMKFKNNQIDFDDMLVLSLRLLREYKYIREEVKAKWDYIQVDEFQDINSIQMSILMILAEDHENMFCVGDANQSLYGFRGANPEFIYKYLDYYPDAKVIKMVNNYRCSDPVVRATNNLASESVYKAGDIIGTGLAGIFEFREYHLQSSAAKFVSDFIKQRLSIPGVEPRDFAVIYRTNGMSRPYEDVLFTADIPYVVKGGDPFYLTREVQDILTYLSLAQDPDTFALRKVKAILSRPSRYLGAQFLESLGNRLATGATLEASLMGPYPERKGWEPGAKMLATQLAELRQFKKSIVKAIDYIRNDIEYDGFLQKAKDNPESAIAYVEELQHISSTFSSVEEFLKVMKERIKAAKAQNKERNPNAVVLTTIHSAKGLEFKYVVVANFYKGALPHSRATSIDEEQRALYVAMTRTKEDCTLLSHRASNQNQSDESKWNKESPFLEMLGLKELNFSELEEIGEEYGGCRIMRFPKS